jgi:xanthine/uracil permease
VLVAGLLMMIFGCFNKFSAFVVTIPDPIIGASILIEPTWILQGIAEKMIAIYYLTRIELKMLK